MDSESNISIKKKGKLKSIIFASVSVLVIIAAIVIIIISLNNNISDSYFVSDGSKLVLDLSSLKNNGDEYAPENSYLVYNYSGNEITGFKAYYKYSTAEAAKKAYDFYFNDGDNNYKTVELKGNYVVITANESDYKSLTAEDVKQQIEYMNSVEIRDQDTGTNTSDTQTESTESDSNTPDEGSQVIPEDGVQEVVNDVVAPTEETE